MLPITVKVAPGDSSNTGEARHYAQVEIGPGDTIVTVYESLIEPGVVIIDIDRAGKGEGTPIKIAVNDTCLDDTTIASDAATPLR